MVEGKHFLWRTTERSILRYKADSDAVNWHQTIPKNTKTWQMLMRPFCTVDLTKTCSFISFTEAKVVQWSSLFANSRRPKETVVKVFRVKGSLRFWLLSRNEKCGEIFCCQTKMELLDLTVRLNVELWRPNTAWRVRKLRPNTYNVPAATTTNKPIRIQHDG